MEQKQHINPLLGYIAILLMFGCAVGIGSSFLLMLTYWATFAIPFGGAIVFFAAIFMIIKDLAVHPHAQEHHENFIHSFKHNQNEPKYQQK